MRPNPTKHDPSTVADLVNRLYGLGMTKSGIARAIGIGRQTLVDQCKGNTRASYPVQFTLESLLRSKLSELNL